MIVIINHVDDTCPNLAAKPFSPAAQMEMTLVIYNPKILIQVWELVGERQPIQWFEMAVVEMINKKAVPLVLTFVAYVHICGVVIVELHHYVPDDKRHRSNQLVLIRVHIYIAI